MRAPSWRASVRDDRGRPASSRRPSIASRALAADGHSNKEIAHTLYVSVHTVETHLTHVYAKLGVRSRAQLAGRLAARP